MKITDGYMFSNHQKENLRMKMNLRCWILFAGAQLIGGFLLTPTMPVFLKWIGSLLLLPGTALLFLFGPKIAGVVMVSNYRQAAVGFVFLGVNALTWVAVSHFVNSRRESRRQGQVCR